MEIKVQNRIRQKPAVIGLRLKSFFILLFSGVLLVLAVLGSFSFMGFLLVGALLCAEYVVLYYLDRFDSNEGGDFPDRIVNS